MAKGDKSMNQKSTGILMMLGVVLTVIIVVALALVASGVSDNNLHQDKLQIPTENNTYSLNSTNASNGTKGGVKIKISPSEAQKIAETYVKQPGAKVGIPQLDEVDGQMVYTVPIMINGSNVGQININAVTGKNMGGAGGAP